MLAILIVSDWGLSCMTDVPHFYLTLSLLFSFLVCISAPSLSPRLHQGAEYTSHPYIPSAQLSAQLPTKCQLALLSGVMLLWPLSWPRTLAPHAGAL